MRKLATIREISEVLPIEGADAIVLVKVDDWHCVALKEEFKPGDSCVYFEIDSFIPITPAIEHLRSRAFKRMGDKEGIRIKTIRLRGQLSQGLALPCNKFPEVQEKLAQLFNEHSAAFMDENCIDMAQRIESVDWTEVLGVDKFELPIPSELEGQVRGNFPGFIKKTSQERCQNLGRNIFQKKAGSRYEVSMKVDGTSFTAYRLNETAGVCGRNWELDLDEFNDHNSLVRMYIDNGIQGALHDLGLNIALQGELMGPGIVKNREGFTTHKLFVFDIYDIDNSKYFSPEVRHHLLNELWSRGMDRNSVQTVPIHHMGVTLEELGITDVAGLLRAAEGPSINHAIREGEVYKSLTEDFSFKVISNKYLLKEED